MIMITTIIMIIHNLTIIVKTKAMTKIAIPVAALVMLTIIVTIKYQ